jgi:uncharacterized protein
VFHYFSEYSNYTLVALAVLSFIAGFIDAVAGGGGLIQIPALLITLGQYPLPTLFGTSKLAGFSGTGLSAIQYAKRIKFNFKLLALIAFSACVSSFAGAKTVSLLDPNILKPFVLVILVIIALYTAFKKDLGTVQSKQLPLNKQYIYGASIGLLIGFYDGFFGPGTGSFLVMAFVLILGFEFIQASAYAKAINFFTNISAITVFVKQGNYLLPIALLMAVFNTLGNIIGARMALAKGNQFVRIVFLVVVLLLICRYAYDLLK